MLIIGSISKLVMAPSSEILLKIVNVSGSQGYYIEPVVCIYKIRVYEFRAVFFSVLFFSLVMI